MQYPPELPISQRRDEIVSAIQAHQTIVLTGETGSGKTTQIPKMCLDAGLGSKGRIACTQPRRVAALSVAKRVAEELKVDFGKEVGAKIRFTDQTSKQTRVKFMTDGMLLTEIHGDPLMRDYEAVIIDEAHERSLNIDFLLGHLNQLRARRPDLKIIITSATIDTEKFSAAFDHAPIIEVSGRVYPVDIIYTPLDELLEDSGDFTYIEGIAESAKRIQDEFGSGDILAFLPTEKDIREAMDLLESRFSRRMEIIPCFGRLSNADQQRIFQSSPKRKLILATNIAETSLTIPGIRFVIDTGLARISRYNPRGRTKRLPIAKVSQSSANQRSGRCGRVADGICIRLYSEKDYLSRPVYSIPEIQRSNLADVILRMTASHLGNVETFPFIDPPAPAAITAGYQLLEELGAFKGRSDLGRATQPDQNTPRTLTPLGQKLSRLPADPTVGRMLLEAERHGVTHEVLVIAAALSIQDPRERPMDKEAAARQAHAQFDHPQSDFLALLNIWEALHDNFEKLSQSRLRKFCKQNFLNYLRIREWRDIYQQLERSLPKRKRGTDTPAAHRTGSPSSELDRDSARYYAIHACLLTGLLANVGRREETNLYLCSANRKPLIFPGSSLFIRQPRDKKTGKRKDPGTESGKKKRKSPEWILSAEIVETNRLYARTVAAIDPRWILEVGRHIVAHSYSDPEFLPDQGRVVARESIRIHGLEIQNKQVSYLKVDPAKATEIFIREALLNEDYEAPANWTFLEQNRRLISRIQNAQTVISVAHWMGVEEAAFQFYQKRLKNVASNADLNRYLKNKVGLDGPASRNAGSPETLLMSEVDLTASEDAAIDLSLFPETVELGNSALPIEYQYKHGHEKDGVTLRLPYSKAKSINNVLLDWLIPGHLEPKIHALLKALPKHLRQRLIPLAETAKTIATQIRPTGDTLIASLQNHLKEAYSLETYASDWDESAIPEHLRARIEVHDKKGQTIAEARDAQSLHQKLEAKQAELSATQANDTSALWKKARAKYEREITSIADLRLGPDRKPASADSKIQIGQPNGIPLYAYPALRSSSSEGGTALRSSSSEGGTALRSSSSEGGTALRSSSSNSPFTLRLSLFRSPEEAKASSASGIAALLEHELRRELAWIRTDLKDVQRVGPAGVAFRPIPELKEDVYEHIRQTLRTHELDTLDPDILHAAREKAHEKSKGILYKVVDQLKLILEKRQSLIVQTDIAKRYAADIDRLLPPDFLRHTPNHILPRLPVYLDTIAHRAKTAAQNPSRDAQRQSQLDHYRQRLAQVPPSASSAVSKLRWMIEEFAISLFAQHLGTAHPISPKKLDQAFAEAGGNALATPAPTKQAQDTSRLKGSNPSSQKAREAKTDRPTQADLNSLKNLFR
ncbi:ATP-dependent RNA helicase HrpA [Pelagicoccus sp. SDUM812005]|uniref:ATP-dependent RNA helicase HrpA n=1 Tax=Pelagicoccus sp. SDUM812005 TaxID=3041257 RepID=UPI00280E9E67|nr:ATP-dependent RNA helicase HrpA [Pelagicoccus sp. SDUM812005]MDQ8182423.1 ATP-dependent RNA helicase HrpA [Pelagicoccus sp. SDUM812005]